MDNTDQLVSDVITSVNANSSTIMDTLTEQGTNVGYSMTTAMESVWGTSGTATSVLSTFSEDFKDKSTTLQSTVSAILAGVERLYAGADTKASSDVSVVDNTSKTGSNPQVNSVTSTGSGNAGGNTNNNQKQEETLGPVSGISGTLKKGARNSDVKELQKALKKLGYKDQNGTKLLIDGWFGPKTQAALKKFQKAMKVTQSGKLDDATKKAFKKKGYWTGTDYVKQDEWAELAEKGREIVTNPDGSIALADGTTLRRLEKGSGVINNPNTEKLLDLANNYDAIQKIIDSVGVTSSAQREASLSAMEKMLTNNVVNNNVGGEPINYVLENVTFNLPNVYTPEDFMNWMMKSKKTQRAMQEYVFGETNGKCNLATRRFRF